MVADFTIRDYQENDEKEIVELLDTVFEGWPKLDIKCSSLDHWRWKYQENYLNCKPISVSEKNGKIIGVIHSLPQKVKIFDDIFLVALGGDVAVYSEYRRLGVWDKLRVLQDEQMKRIGFKFTYLATGNPVVINRFDSSPIHYRLPLEVIYYVKIRDLELHLMNNPVENAWIQKIGYVTLKTIGGLKNLTSSSNISNSNINIKDIEKFDENVNKFWDNIKTNYSLIFESDQKFLNWRYCDSRAGSYIVKQATENGDVVGFVCLMIDKIRPDYPVGIIAELQYMSGRVDILESLLSEVVDYFDKNNVNIVVFVSVRYPQLNEALEKNGFIDSRKNYHIFYHLGSEEDYLKKVSQSSLEKQHFVSGNIL